MRRDSQVFAVCSYIAHLHIMVCCKASFNSTAKRFSRQNLCILLLAAFQVIIWKPSKLWKCFKQKLIKAQKFLSQYATKMRYVNCIVLTVYMYTFQTQNFISHCIFSSTLIWYWVDTNLFSHNIYLVNASHTCHAHIFPAIKAAAVLALLLKLTMWHSYNYIFQQKKIKLQLKQMMAYNAIS